MENYVSLTLGMLCAGAGCELLLRGAMGLATWLRMPPAIAGATVAMFSQAGAEIAVVVAASWILRPDLALGAALGTSIVNLGLVMAIVCFSPGGVPVDAGARICTLALAAPLSVAFFARHGGVSRRAGALLLAFFAGWLLLAIREAWRNSSAEPKAEEPIAEHRGWLAVSFCFVGLLLLDSTGRLIVKGAEGLVIDFQLDYFTLGATLVPLCTTVPKLTGVFALRNRNLESVSTTRLLENSLLNAWFLGGLAAVIAPFRVSAPNVAIASATAALLALLCWPSARVSPRVRGVVQAAVYLGFVLNML